QRLREEREKGGSGKLVILIIVGGAFWAGVFGVLYLILRNLQSRGAGTAHSRQDSRADSAFLYLHPGPLERHHGAVELFPREGPRPARLGAGRLAAAVSRQTRRDTAPFVVDGGADGRADPGGL